jgi:hypothetical protein
MVRRTWKECVAKVSSDRIPKQILKYQQNDREYKVLTAVGTKNYIIWDIMSCSSLKVD